MSGTEQETMELSETMPAPKAVAIDPNKLNLREELITLNRCAKVVKGGRRFSFSALVAVGDGEGHVGLGFGKANEVPEAITKAVENGKKNLHYVPLMGRTLPHEIIGQYCTARVMLKPASQGTGLIAGAQARKVLELAGVHDILAKSLGSDNVMNVAKATLNGLISLMRPEQVARLRGKELTDLIGTKSAQVYQDSMRRVFGESEEEKRARAEAEKAKAEAEKKAAEAPAAEAPAAPEAAEPTTPAPESGEQPQT